MADNDVPVWEYQLGVFVAAADEQAAWEVVRPISEALDRIDVEGDSSTDGPFSTDMQPHPPTEPQPLVLLPSIDELADWMVQLAQKDGFTTTQRFRNSMKGWAKLAHQALSGEKK